MSNVVKPKTNIVENNLKLFMFVTNMFIFSFLLFYKPMINILYTTYYTNPELITNKIRSSLETNIDYNKLSGSWYELYNNDDYNDCIKMNLTIHKNNFSKIHNIKNNFSTVNIDYIFITTNYSFNETYYIINSTIYSNINSTLYNKINKKYIFYLKNDTNGNYEYMVLIIPQNNIFKTKYSIKIYNRNPFYNISNQKNIVNDVEYKLKNIGINILKYFNYIKKINYNNNNCKSGVNYDFIDTGINNFNINNLFGQWFVILFGNNYNKIQSYNNICNYIKIDIANTYIKKNCLNSLNTFKNGSYTNSIYENIDNHLFIKSNNIDLKKGRFHLTKNNIDNNNNSITVLNNIDNTNNSIKYQILNYYSLHNSDNINNINNINNIEEYEYLLLSSNYKNKNNVLLLSKLPIINKKILSKYLYILYNNKIIDDYIINNYNNSDYYNN